MMLGKDYFVVSLPYQIAIKEGLLQRAQLEDEMSEDDFDPTIFSMEMEALFYGDTDGSFFKFDELNNRRTLKNCFYPLPTKRHCNPKTCSRRRKNTFSGRCVNEFQEERK